MKLTIQSAEATGREELRTLLIDDAEMLAGEGARVLEPRLPWKGYPILLVDKQLHPVLVSFDTESAQAALLNGLQAAEQLSSALPWVNQVYDKLLDQQRPLQLIVVSRETPAGANAILADCPHLHLFRYTALHVNGETGLWLEAVNSSTVSTKPDNAVIKKSARRSARFPGREPGPVQLAPVPSQEIGKLPALSDEENSFFQQL